MKLFIRIPLLVMLLLLVACEETILSDLSELQANRALVTLGKSGLTAKKQNNSGTWEIKVEKSLQQRALILLAEHRFLENQPSGETSNARKGLMLSREEREEEIRQGQAARIQETLLRLPGVLDARVHLFSHGSKKSVLSQPTELAAESAGVLLISAEQEVPADAARTLVAGAAGLNESQVQVVVVRHPQDRGLSDTLKPNKNEGSAAMPFPPQEIQEPWAWSKEKFLRLSNQQLASALIALCLFCAVGGFRLVQARKKRALEKRLRGLNGSAHLHHGEVC